MEIKILKNIRSNRIILVDKKTGQAFISFGKKDEQYAYFMNHYSDIIEDYTPRV
jgi:hypothetical protein